MEPYTLQALQSDLQGFISLQNILTNVYKIAFSAQYVTGCRFTELQEPARWQIYNTNFVTLQPLKNGNLRTFAAADLPADFVTLIRNADLYLSNLNLSTGSYYFRKFYPQKKVYHLDKQITTHLFRHHYAKKLFATGSTRPEIQILMGEVDIKNSNGYIDSILMFESR